MTTVLDKMNIDTCIIEKNYQEAFSSMDKKRKTVNGKDVVVSSSIILSSQLDRKNWHLQVGTFLLTSLIFLMIVSSMFPSSSGTPPMVAAAPTTTASTMVSLEANSTLIASGESISFLITLYYQDPVAQVWTPLVNQSVTLTWLNDTSRRITLMTDDKGQVTTTWTLTTSAYGLHLFNASFLGTNDYSASWDVLTVEIRESLPSGDSSGNDIWFTNVLINGSTNVVSFNAGEVMEVTVTLQAGGGASLGPGVFKIFDDTMGIELYHEDVPYTFNLWDYPSHDVSASWKIPIHAPEGVHSIRLWYSGDASVRSGSFVRTIDVAVQLGIVLDHQQQITRTEENLTVITRVLGPDPVNKRVMLKYKHENATSWTDLPPKMVVNRQVLFDLSTNKTWPVGNYTIRAELQSLDGTVVHAVADSWFIIMGRADLTIVPSSSTLHHQESITFQVTSHAADSLTQPVIGRIWVRDDTDDILIFNGTTDLQGEIIVTWIPTNLTLGIHQLNFTIFPLSSSWKAHSTTISMQYVEGSGIIPRTLPAEIIRGQTLNVTVSVYRNGTKDLIVDPSLKIQLVPWNDENTTLAEAFLTSSMVLLSYQIPSDAPSGPHVFTLRFEGNLSLSPSTYNFTVNVLVPTHFLGYSTNYSATKTISAGMILAISVKLGDNTNLPLSNQLVKVTLGSSLVFQASTNSEGWAIIQWKIPFSQPPQLYSIKITFSGNASSYLLASANAILDAVTVTPPLGVTPLERMYRGSVGMMLVTGPGNEQVTISWERKFWNVTAASWQVQEVTYLVTLNSSGQYELAAFIPSNTLVGPSYWRLNSSLDPNRVVLNIVDIYSVEAIINVTVPPDPILVGSSYRYQVRAEFDFTVLVDSLQITMSAQRGGTVFGFDYMFTTRGTHEIRVIIEDANMTPYLDQSDLTVIIVVREAIKMSVIGSTVINNTDLAQYPIFVRGNYSDAGVSGASVRVVIHDLMNNNATLTSIVTNTNVNGEATMTLGPFFKGRYLLNFTAWHESDPFWHGMVIQQVILTVMDPITNLTVSLPSNGTIYRISRVTMDVKLHQDDMDASITWMLYFLDETTSSWQPHPLYGSNTTMLFVNFTYRQVFTQLNDGTYRLVIGMAGPFRIIETRIIIFHVNEPLHPVTIWGDINGSAPGEWYVNKTALSFMVDNASSWYQYRYYYVENVDVVNQTFLDLISVTFFSEGTYVIHVYVGNDGYQFHHVTIILHVDLTAPVITILSPVNGSTYAGTSIMVDLVSDETMKGWWYRVDGESAWHSWNGTSFDLMKWHSLGEGVHQLEIKGQDLAGNYDDEVVTFIIDFLAPEFYIVSPTSNQWFSARNITITLWLLSDPSNVSFMYWLDGSNAIFRTNETTFSIIVPSDGLHVIHVLANNTAWGVTSEQTVVIQVDSVAPSILVMEPSNSSSWSVPWVNMSFSVMDSRSGLAAVTFDLKIDNGTFLYRNESIDTSNFVFDDLSNGTYYLVIRAWDGVGNLAESMIVFRVEIPSLRITWNEAVQYHQLENGSYLLNSSVLVMTFNGTQDGLEFKLEPLMTEFQPANTTTSLTLRDVPDGIHVLTVNASRFNGKEFLVKKYYFIVDTSGPIVTAIELVMAAHQNVTNAVVFDLYVNASDNLSPFLTIVVNNTEHSLTLINATTHLWHGTVIISLTDINVTAQFNLVIVVKDWLEWSSPPQIRTWTYQPPSVSEVILTPDDRDDHVWQVAVTITEGSAPLKQVSARLVTDNGTVIDLALRKKIGQMIYVGTIDFSSWESVPSYWFLSLIISDELKEDLVFSYWFSPFWENGLPTVQLVQVNPLDERNATWSLVVELDDLPPSNDHETLTISVHVIDNLTQSVVTTVFLSRLEETSNLYSGVVLLPKPSKYKVAINITMINRHGISSLIFDLNEGVPLLQWHDAPPMVLRMMFVFDNGSREGGYLYVNLTDDHGIILAWVTVTTNDSSLAWNVTLQRVNATWYQARIDFHENGTYRLRVHVIDDVLQAVARDYDDLLEVLVKHEPTSTPSTTTSSSALPSTGTTITRNDGPINDVTAGRDSPSTRGSSGVNTQGSPILWPYFSLESFIGLITILGGGSLGARWYRRRKEGVF